MWDVVIYWVLSNKFIQVPNSPSEQAIMPLNKCYTNLPPPFRYHHEPSCENHRPFLPRLMRSHDQSTANIISNTQGCRGPIFTCEPTIGWHASTIALRRSAIPSCSAILINSPDIWRSIPVAFVRMALKLATNWNIKWVGSSDRNFDYIQGLVCKPSLLTGSWNVTFLCWTTGMPEVLLISEIIYYVIDSVNLLGERYNMQNLRGQSSIFHQWFESGVHIWRARVKTSRKNELNVDTYHRRIGRHFRVRL